MAYSCNCTCISRHGLVISMKIIIVRTRGFDKMDQIPYTILVEQNIGGFYLKQGKLKVYGVNFDSLLLKFTWGWGLLNMCMYVYVCKHFWYIQSYTWPSCLQECMDANTRGWTGVQKRRRQWFWSICCSCAKERCCCWALPQHPLTSMYVMALLDLLADFLELLCR